MHKIHVAASQRLTTRSGQRSHGPENGQEGSSCGLGNHHCDEKLHNASNESHERLAPTYSPSSSTSISQQEDGQSTSIFSIFSKFDVAKHDEFLQTLRPQGKRSYNLAAYVNQSPSLQQLLRLGVSLYDIENTNYKAASRLLTLNFERDCVDHIRFLVDIGLHKRNLGRFISEYPEVFDVPIDDLQARINYLESKNFTRHQITQALNRSSCIIRYPTKTTDNKLGHLQIEFRLPAVILRRIVVKYPEVIFLPENQYKLVNFVFKEEFGFKTHEIHEILELVPETIDILRPVLLGRLELLHSQLGLGHRVIARFPKLIVGPRQDIEYRGEYLKKLKRDQYDPSKPLYVPPSALYDMSDASFCSRYAKTSVDDYKLFIKSL